MKIKLPEIHEDTLAELVVKTLAKRLEGKNLVNLNGCQKFPILGVSYETGEVLVEIKQNESTKYVSSRGLSNYRIRE